MAPSEANLFEKSSVSAAVSGIAVTTPCRNFCATTAPPPRRRDPDGPFATRAPTATPPGYAPTAATTITDKAHRYQIPRITLASKFKHRCARRG